MIPARTRAGLTTADQRQQFATDVRYYLSLEPRQLPSQYLYDALGSALFDAICQLPWYTLTSSEAALLEHHGEVVLAHDDLSAVVELGPGNGDKLRRLFETSPASAAKLRVHLVDVSASALMVAVQALRAMGVGDVVAHEATYERGLDDVTAARSASDRLLVLFLGSNIGNFDPPGREAFLRHLRASLRADDLLLLGTDLRRPERELLLAYDDPLGVTAAFNRNLLVRMNRELGADFDLSAFAHQAVWNDEQSRIEMRLVATRTQLTTIRDADLQFTVDAGEFIWTESSYKFTLSEVATLLVACGFDVRHQWKANSFGLTLAAAG